MATETPSLLAAFGSESKPAADSGSESDHPKPEASTKGLEAALKEAGFDDVSPGKAKAFKRAIRMAMD